MKNSVLYKICIQSLNTILTLDVSVLGIIETSEVRTSLVLQNFPEVDEVLFFPLKHLY